MDALSIMAADFEGEPFKSRLQETHVFDSSYFGANGDFTAPEAARSCSAALEGGGDASLAEADEFVYQTRDKGPRGVIFLHYDARDVSTVVDEHFHRSLYPLRAHSAQAGDEFKNTGEVWPDYELTTEHEVWLHRTNGTAERAIISTNVLSVQSRAESVSSERGGIMATFVMVMLMPECQVVSRT